jgi:hypothetical protein
MFDHVYAEAPGRMLGQRAAATGEGG